MTDFATTEAAPGVPMQRLADRLSSLTPPHVAAELANARPSPAVEAALKRSAKAAALAAKRAQRARNRTLVGAIVESFSSRPVPSFPMPWWRFVSWWRGCSSCPARP